MGQDLVTRAQNGDQRAFESLTEAHHPRLFRVAHGILRDAHLAEDATRLAFIDIWRHLRRLRDPAKFNGFAGLADSAPAGRFRREYGSVVR